jgi:hypothetical protein
VSIRDFKSWVIAEKTDIFGFERERERFRQNVIIDEDPLKPLMSEKVLDELERHSLGIKPARRSWSDLVEWGDGGLGTLQVSMSPVGSLSATIRRKINDLEGNEVWVCKHIYPMKDNLIGKEMNLAHDVLENVQKIDMAMVDMPSHDYKEMNYLANQLYGQIKLRRPPIFMQTNMKKMAENVFLFYLEPTGTGVEAPTADRLEQFNINLTYSPKTGLIRCWGNDVLSPTKGHKWELQPSEWDEYFCPSQPRKEIVESIINALSVY